MGMTFAKLQQEYEAEAANVARKHSPHFKARVEQLLKSTGIKFDRLVMGMGGWALVEKPKAIPMTYDDDPGEIGYMEGNDLLAWAKNPTKWTVTPKKITEKARVALCEVAEILEYLNEPRNQLELFDLKF